jgi:hypothetical protein
MSVELDKDFASKAVVAVLAKLCQKAENLSFSQDPEVVAKDVIEFYSRMRVLGLEKFGDPCYISVVNFYSSEADQKAHKASGTLLVYAEEENAPRLFKALGITQSLEEDEERLIQSTGELAKRIAQGLKSEVLSQGGRELIVSEPIKAKNDIAEGVEFPYRQYKYSEINFYFWRKKSVVIGIVMDPLRVR